LVLIAYLIIVVYDSDPEKYVVLNRYGSCGLDPRELWFLENG